MGGISILIGILILYGNALFGAYMELTGSAGPNTIAEISSLLLRNCLLCSWIDFYCFFFFKNKVKLQSVGVFILPPLIVS
ncbi:hypothetical protein OBCHQ24_15430 [Oceanobacillus iheyensis]|nr:hypothetical protein OBCHQ24_15430 [Oceanobacillus iheyensis]